MQAWKGNTGPLNDIYFFAYGRIKAKKVLGLEFDRRDYGLGIRSKYCTLCADDEFVKILQVEEVGSYGIR